MISLRVFAAATVALTAIGRPAAAPVIHNAATAGTVLSLLVHPDSARVAVAVAARGDVRREDLTVRGPGKIVVDIAQVSLGLARGEEYDHAGRGGIVNVHYAQYKPSVVRVVLTLDAPHSYRVSREAAGIRISVEGSTSNLPAWAVGYVNATLATVAPPPVTSLSHSTAAPSRPAAPKYTARPNVRAGARV